LLRWPTPRLRRAPFVQSLGTAAPLLAYACCTNAGAAICASDAALRHDLGSEATITLAVPIRANACAGEGLALGVERADQICTRGRCWPDARHWREPRCLRQVLPLSFPASPTSARQGFSRRAHSDVALLAARPWLCPSTPIGVILRGRWQPPADVRSEEGNRLVVPIKRAAQLRTSYLWMHSQIACRQHLREPS